MSCFKIGKTVTLLGKLLPPNTGGITNNSFTKIAELPNGYYPKNRQFHVIPFINFGAVIIDIATNGDIYVTNLVGDITTANTRVLHLPELKFEAQ